VVLDGKEYDEAGKGDTTSKGSRQDVVVLLPPPCLVPLEIVHEDGRDVDTSCKVGQVNGSPEQEAVEHERGVDVLETSNRGEQDSVEWLENGRGERGLAGRTDVRAKALDRPPSEGEEEAKQEAVLQDRVDLTEDTSRTDGTLMQHVSTYI
jgi:hypothetical protein